MVKWWDKKWGKEQICSINHTRLKCGINKIGIPYTIDLPCNHRFSSKGILEWMNKNQNSNSCPLCRQEFNLEDILIFVYNDYLNRNKVSDKSKFLKNSKKM